MKTTHTGFLLALVLAARLALGQEPPPDPPPAPPPPSEPVPPPPVPPPLPPEDAPPAPSEPAPAPSEPAPAPSDSAPVPPPTAPTSTAEFPAPLPPPSASVQPAPPPPPPPPTASAAPTTPPPVLPPPQTAAKKKDVGEKQDEDEARDETDGVFGPFRIGPVFGVGLPAFLSFGGAVKVTKYFGAGLTYGVVPEIQFAYYGEATVSFQGINAYGHIHPFGGGFFLGAAFGYAHVRATYEEEFDLSRYSALLPPGTDTDLPYTSDATIEMLLLTPELGYFYTFKSGFTLGVEAGLQIPVAPSKIHFDSEIDANLPREVEQAVEDRYIEPADENVRSTLERVGESILPTFGIKIGWLF